MNKFFLLRDIYIYSKAPKSDWRNTNGWDPAIEPSWHHEYVCAFYGIKLADNGYVESIKLGANGLGDNLPGRMLRGLPKLKHLDLSDNGKLSSSFFQSFFSKYNKNTHHIVEIHLLFIFVGKM